MVQGNELLNYDCAKCRKAQVANCKLELLKPNCVEDRAGKQASKTLLLSGTIALLQASVVKLNM